MKGGAHPHDARPPPGHPRPGGQPCAGHGRGLGAGPGRRPGDRARPGRQAGRDRRADRPHRLGIPGGRGGRRRRVAGQVASCRSRTTYSPWTGGAAPRRSSSPPGWRSCPRAASTKGSPRNCRWLTPVRCCRVAPVGLDGLSVAVRTSLRCREFSAIRLGAGRGLFLGSGVAQRSWSFPVTRPGLRSRSTDRAGSAR